jgi:hypothetical protein
MTATYDDTQVTRRYAEVPYAPHLAVLLACDSPLAGGALFSLRYVSRVIIGRGEERMATPVRRALSSRLAPRSIDVVGTWAPRARR